MKASTGSFFSAGHGAFAPSETQASVSRSGDAVSWTRVEGGLTTLQTLTPSADPDLVDVTVIDNTTGERLTTKYEFVRVLENRAAFFATPGKAAGSPLAGRTPSKLMGRST